MLRHHLRTPLSLSANSPLRNGHRTLRWVNVVVRSGDCRTTGLGGYFGGHFASVKGPGWVPLVPGTRLRDAEIRTWMCTLHIPPLSPLGASRPSADTA